MATRVPASPEVLKLAREECGLTIDEAALRIGSRSRALKESRAVRSNQASLASVIWHVSMFYQKQR